MPGRRALPAPLASLASRASRVQASATPPRTLIGLVIFGNFGWAVACIALLVSGVFAVTALGIAWVLAQALCVVVLAELQWTGLRRTRSSAGMALA